MKGASKGSGWLETVSETSLGERGTEPGDHGSVQKSPSFG